MRGRAESIFLSSRGGYGFIFSRGWPKIGMSWASKQGEAHFISKLGQLGQRKKSWINLVQQSYSINKIISKKTLIHGFW